jgi:type I restriction enzyme S subunit
MVETSFKQTEVGLIPEDWYLNKVKDFTYTTAGGTPSTVEDSYWNGNIPWMNSGELNKIKVYNTDNFITIDGLNNSSTKLIPKNCVLIGLAGQGKTRGTVAINKIELCTNQSIGAFYPSSSVFQDYLFYNLQRRYHELRSLSTGDGGRGGLNLFILNNLLIPLPPTIEEQQSIATALGDADTWIESLEKLIAKKRLIKQGAMQELLTPKEDWEVKKLGDFGQVLVGLTYSPNDVREHGTLVLRSSNVQNNKLAFENNVFVEMDLPSRVIVQENDLLICVRNGSRDLIGKCALIDKKTSGQAFGAFMSIFRSENNRFIFHLFQSSIIQKQIEENLGATINQITNKMLKNFEIFVPESNEQTRVANILSDMDAEIDALQCKLQKAQQIKQGMMQQLLTGKIRLVKNTASQPKEIVTAS